MAQKHLPSGSRGHLSAEPSRPRHPSTKLITKRPSFLPLACKVLGPGGPFSGLGLTRVWKPGSSWTCPQPLPPSVLRPPRALQGSPSSMANACSHSRTCSHISTKLLNSLIFSKIWHLGVWARQTPFFPFTISPIPLPNHADLCVLNAEHRVKSQEKNNC